uniref:Tumor protein p53 inducible protein 3 n=2 Tax=Callithrix jacchus TaxID=9483 RepID=A0A8I3VXY7_CALJA
MCQKPGLAWKMDQSACQEVGSRSLERGKFPLLAVRARIVFSAKLRERLFFYRLKGQENLICLLLTLRFKGGRRKGKRGRVVLLGPTPPAAQNPAVHSSGGRGSPGALGLGLCYWDPQEPEPLSAARKVARPGFGSAIPLPAVPTCVPENMLAVHFDKPGGPENLYVKEVDKPSPGEGEVLLKVAASALNRADLMQRQGQYDPPPGASNILGLEASGHVAELGPGCQGHWKIGDAAMALLPGGGQAQYVTVPEGLLMPIPEGLTLLQAAAIPEAWLTAFQLLHLVGNVQAGHHVLIHAGLSGVGTAAIQLTRMAGAIPLVTAGSQQKLQMAEKLGAAAGFNYKEEDFSEATLKFTKGAGVNLILDCIGGSYWEKNVNCLALDGRWVLYGLIGGADINGPLLSKLLFKRGSLITSLLRSRDNKYKQMLVNAFTEQILPHFSKEGPQRLLPVLDRIYPVTEIQEAHKYMETNKNMGKIVLEVPQ